MEYYLLLLIVLSMCSVSQSLSCNHTIEITIDPTKNVNSTYAKVFWEKPPNGTCPGLGNHFTYLLEQDGEIYQEPRNTTAKEYNLIDFKNLEPCTEYTLKIWAVSEKSVNGNRTFTTEANKSASFDLHAHDFTINIDSKNGYAFATWIHKMSCIENYTIRDVGLKTTDPDKVLPISKLKFGDKISYPIYLEGSSNCNNFSIEVYPDKKPSGRNVEKWVDGFKRNYRFVKMDEMDVAINGTSIEWKPTLKCVPNFNLIIEQLDPKKIILTDIKNSSFNDLTKVKGFSNVDTCKQNILKISPDFDDDVIYETLEFQLNLECSNQWKKGCIAVIFFLIISLIALIASILYIYRKLC